MIGSRTQVRLRNTHRFASNWLTVSSLIVILISSSFAQSPWEKQRKTGSGGNGFQTSSVAYTGPLPFRMLHYSLDLRFAMHTGDLGGTVTMTLVAKQAMQSMVLNAVDLTIDSILVNGQRDHATPVQSGEELHVALPTTIPSGDTLYLSVTYHRDPSIARPSGRQGYYYFAYVSNDSGGNAMPDTLGYTMSEPSDARFWMPCYDDPSVKCPADINVTVPSRFVAASNGKLQSVVVNGDGTSTWHWNEESPLPTYLMAVTVSRWSVPSLPFARTANDTIPLQYYVWQADSAKCAAYLPTVAQMIRAYSDRFGPYPFEKYGMACLVPFTYGGMEHMTLTTLNRFYETNEAVVVHELAHQWWGDLVTCGTWNDIWLNESFATYGEALWQESKGGKSALRSYMSGLDHASYYPNWQGAVYDPVEQGFDVFDDIVYSKGAWVLHTLRGVVGDSAFFHGLRAYRAKYQGGAAVTDEFRVVMDSVSGLDLRPFFDQWVYGKGWPAYATSLSAKGDSTFLSLYQSQSSDWSVFTTPIQCRFSFGGHDSLIVLNDSARSVRFGFRFPARLDSVRLDPDRWILRRNGLEPDGITTASTLPAQFALMPNWPNPFNPVTTLEVVVPELSRIQLVVYDILGREQSVLLDQQLSPGTYHVNFDGARLASGVYFARLNRLGPSGGILSSVVRSMVLLR